MSPTCLGTTNEDHAWPGAVDTRKCLTGLALVGTALHEPSRAPPEPMICMRDGWMRLSPSYHYGSRVVHRIHNCFNDPHAGWVGAPATLMSLW
jgi:hypothetical protein